MSEEKKPSEIVSDIIQVMGSETTQAPTTSITTTSTTTAPTASTIESTTPYYGAVSYETTQVAAAPAPVARAAPAQVASTTITTTTECGEVTKAILQSTRPLEIPESELITVHGETGYLLNKSDLATWKGELPLNAYKLNEDPNPEIIHKKSDQKIVFTKEVAVRYLRPPTPPPPGEIFIKQERNIQIPPAPPVVMRQIPARPTSPEPLVIREAPPKPPAALGQKIITISGKKLEPPPRKVIVERLPPMPPPPQSVIIERWLAYPELKRKVIYQKPTEADVVFPTPKNVIIQWEPPAAEVRTEFRDLGIIRANPADYVARYGPSLKQPNELPDFVKEIRPPTGVILAAEYYAKAVHDLEGDIDALTLIDLEREGLAQYKSIVETRGKAGGWYAKPSYAATSYAYSTHEPVKYSTSEWGKGGYYFSTGGYPYEQAQKSSYYQEAPHPTSYAAAVKTEPSQRNTDAVLQDVFNMIDKDANGFVTIDEVRRIFLILNSRLNRSYGEEDAQAFIRALDKNQDGKVEFYEFKQALASSV